MRYIHIWRCPAHVLKGKAYKLESKTEVCLFLGCPKGTRGYSFYSPKEMKVFVATNARFLKEEYVNNNRPKSEVILDEMVDVRETTSSEFFEDEVVVSNTPQITVDETPSSIIRRRSGRIVRALDRFIGIANVAISDEFESDPSTYNGAVNNVDADQWVKAIKSELELLYSNNVWSLVKAPNDIKPIGCKWVYKRKRGVDGKVETFKARLVTKGFTQKEGIDYEETFSPIAMLKSIQLLLAIAAHFDYEIWQMDVKTAFLNWHFDEDIYMMQLDGVITENQENILCKLKRSIYETSGLIRQSNSLVLNKTSMSHVCTRSIKDKIVTFWCYMLMTSYSLEMM